MPDSLAVIKTTKKTDSLDSLIVKPNTGSLITLPFFTLLKSRDEKGFRAYSQPILVYCDNAVLKNPGYLSDCEKLDAFLKEYTQGLDLSNMKIDQLNSQNAGQNHPKPISSSYHPLAVVRKAMDYRFLVDLCNGTWEHRKEGKTCGRIRANGYWIDAPPSMKSSIEDYVKKGNPTSHGMCPECKSFYFSQL